MNLVLPTNKVPFTLVFDVETERPELIKIVAKDNRKPFTYYYRRKGEVDGKRSFELKMPQTPPVLQVSIYNEMVGNVPLGQDSSFSIENVEAKKLKEVPVWLTPMDREFIAFAQWFAENASILSAGDMKPHVYRSAKSKFTIDYYKKIRDRESGATLNTPARIGHLTGVIEVSKDDLLRMTVPMRLVILLHEYSHKYKNPKIGRSIRDEVAADINALRMYLSLGYGEIEAHYAYLNVFRHANSAGNSKRYSILKDFIERFHKGEFANITTNYVATT